VVKYQGQRHEHLGKEMVLIHHQWWYYADTKEEADQWWLECQRKSAIAALKRIYELTIKRRFYDESEK
jgi:hypothetical protein